MLPLSQFPESEQERIAALVALPKPPSRYISLGLAEIPSRAWFEWYFQRGIDPRKRRVKVSAATRRAVIERDGFVCRLCGDGVEPSDIHLDHKVPVSLGGPTEIFNLQVAHSACNLRKGASVGPS